MLKCSRTIPCKVWTLISTLKDGEVLQDDLNNLTSWSDKWKLGFNPEKCKIMHIGHSFNIKYSMNVQGKVWELEETKEERDLGIIVTSNLKPSQQCIKATSKARSILGWINRYFGLLNTDEFKILYKTCPASYGILYSSLVSVSPEIYQMLGKDSTKSDQDGSRIEGHCL